MKISDKIRQNRRRGGLTQEQFAQKIGVSAQTVSKWENEVAMPDIMLLPSIAEVFGISIDELFDLTIEQKMNRIENRIEIVEEFTPEEFREYEIFLLDQLDDDKTKLRSISLLANLYHHRIEEDSRKVSKYAKQAILLAPEIKCCQWLLTKADGHTTWDWNISNHSDAIDFYKEVIFSDNGVPKTSFHIIICLIIF